MLPVAHNPAVLLINLYQFAMVQTSTKTPNVAIGAPTRANGVNQAQDSYPILI